MLCWERRGERLYLNVLIHNLHKTQIITFGLFLKTSERSLFQYLYTVPEILSPQGGSITIHLQAKKMIILHLTAGCRRTFTLHPNQETHCWSLCAPFFPPINNLSVSCSASRQTVVSPGSLVLLGVSHLMQLPQENLRKVKGGEADPHS